MKGDQGNRETGEAKGGRKGLNTNSKKSKGKN
jgi:hypothetical protein